MDIGVDKVDEDPNESINKKKSTPGESREEEDQEKVLTYSDDGGKDHLRFSAMERDERTQTLVGFTGERDYEIAP